MGTGAGKQNKYVPPRIIHVAEGPGCAKNGQAIDDEDMGASAPGRDTLHVGAIVRLIGLKAAPELNGESATVLSFDPQITRWTVRLESGEEKAVKPENTKVIPLRIGAKVRLKGLQADSSLNGLLGTIEAYDSHTGRWTVRLPGGVKKALKIANLQAVKKKSKIASPRGMPEEVPEYSGAGPFRELEGSPLHIALERGSLRLARGSYFEDRQKCAEPWERRQEIDEADLWSPEDAARLWLAYGSAFFLAVSYGWLGEEHSDPQHWQLDRLARVVREWRAAIASPEFRDLLRPRSKDEANPLAKQAPPDVGVFLDFVCMNQQLGKVSSLEEMEYHAGMEVMAHVYGHTHTTVLQLTAVPPRVPRRYHFRGWTAFESCLANNKMLANEKIYTFGDEFDPSVETREKVAFLRKYRQCPAPPCSAIRFSELLAHCEEELSLMPEPQCRRLFTQASDRSFAASKFRLAWEEQRRVPKLDFKACGWGDPEALQLSSLLPNFCDLGSVNLSGNKIGDAGIEAVLTALAGSSVHSLDVSDNNVGAAAIAAMCALLPNMGNLEVLYLFANPFNRDEGSRWQLTTAWRATGKPMQNLILDHFAVANAH